jgi:hypothetical protein
MEFLNANVNKIIIYLSSQNVYNVISKVILIMKVKCVGNAITHVFNVFLILKMVV